MSIYYRNLWVSILLGLPGHREYLYMWFDILFGTWDYLLSAVGVGHLGTTRSGGSAFYSYHWDPSVTPWLELSCWHLPSFWLWIIDVWLYLFWWILYLYLIYGYISFDGCCIFIWCMDVSCILDGFIYLLYSYHGSEEDDVLLISYVYSFKPFIPCDMYSGWLSIPN
jgi:hypothetical protein